VGTPHLIRNPGFSVTQPCRKHTIEEFGLLIAAEKSFAEWDNEEDRVYDTV